MPDKKLKDGTTVPQKQNGGAKKKNLDVIPSQESVTKLASYGCTLNEIADFHNVDVNTIRRRFKLELKVGKVDVKIRLRKAQLKLAIEGQNATMQIWLGKQMLNQTDNGTFEEDELLDDVDFTLDDSSEQG